MRKTLFVGFDGVMHGTFQAEAAPFCWLPLLEGQQCVEARHPSEGVQPPHGYSALDAQASESDFDYDHDINTSLALMSDDFEFYFLGVH